MDAVKKFEGGKLPEKLMKTVDEERKVIGDHLAQCENDLREIREFVARTQEDFQKIRSQTRKLKNEVNELRDFNKMALKRSWSKDPCMGKWELEINELNAITTLGTDHEFPSEKGETEVASGKRITKYLYKCFSFLTGHKNIFKGSYKRMGSGDGL